MEVEASRRMIWYAQMMSNEWRPNVESQFLLEVDLPAKRLDTWPEGQKISLHLVTLRVRNQSVVGFNRFTSRII